MDILISNLGDVKKYFTYYNSKYDYNLDSDEINWKNSYLGKMKLNVEDKSYRNSYHATNASTYRLKKIEGSKYKSNLNYHNGFTFEYNEKKLNKINDFFKSCNPSYFENLSRKDYLQLKISWKLLKYETGGKFKCHVDGVKNERHLGTIILLPPKSLSKFEGGELVLYKGEEKIIVESDKLNWIFVFIPINTKHEITEITSGIRFSFVKSFVIDEDIYYFMKNTPVKISDININKIKKKKVDKDILMLEKKIEILQTKISNLQKYEEPLNFFDEKIIDEMELDYKIKNDKDLILILRNYIESNNIHDIDYNDYQILEKVLKMKPGYEIILINCLANIYFEDTECQEYLEWEECNEIFDKYELKEEYNFEISIPSFPKINTVYLDKQQPGILVDTCQTYNDEYYELEGERKVSVIYFRKKLI